MVPVPSPTTFCLLNVLRQFFWTPQGSWAPLMRYRPGEMPELRLQHDYF